MVILGLSSLEQTGSLSYYKLAPNWYYLPPSFTMCFKLDSFGVGVYSLFSDSYFVLSENSLFPQLKPCSAPLYFLGFCCYSLHRIKNKSLENCSFCVQLCKSLYVTIIALHLCH